MNRKIVGVFHTEYEASQAIEDLKSHGFLTEDISVIARNKRDVEAINEETGTKAPEGMASGAATGGLLGGVTGLLAGIGALAIPGIGPIIAAGPIAATLTGAAIGAGTGGLVGGLIGLGIPEDEAESYENAVDEGRILVMVDADNNRAGDVYSVFRNHSSANAERYIEDSGLSASRRDVADNSVSDVVDAAFNGSGLEGRNDTGLDTMNSAPVHDLPDNRAHEDINQPGMKADLYSGTPDGMGKDVDNRSPLAFEDEDEEARRLRLREEARAKKTGDVKVNAGDELLRDHSRRR